MCPKREPPTYAEVVNGSIEATLVRSVAVDLRAWGDKTWVEQCSDD